MLKIALSTLVRRVRAGMRCSAACAGLAAALLGCGPDPNGDDTAAALFRAVCELNLRCSGAPSDDPADCDPDRYCFYPEVAPETRIQGAGECARALRGLDCGRLTSIASVAPGCRLSMLQLADRRGVSGQGGPCRHDIDCIEGQLCSIDAETEACGMCAAAPAEGERCADGRCAPGAHCDVEDRCRADAAEGEPCERSRDCAGFLSCAAGRCEPPSLREGDACELGAGAACTDGLVCLGGSCRKLPGAGEACDFAGCSLGLVCHDETCVAPAACGEGRAGEACYGGVCAQGLICDLAEARCIEKASLVASGGFCEADGDCQSQVCLGGVCAQGESCGVDFYAKQRAPVAAKGPKARLRPSPGGARWMGSWRALLVP